MTTTTVKERPIIFTAESVRAILGGRKTQTRRVVRGKACQAADEVEFRDGKWWFYDNKNRRCCDIADFKPGERLWVKERWCCPCIDGAIDEEQTLYAADGQPIIACDEDGYSRYRKDGSEASPWISPLLMSRKRSRITLEIVNVRVERLQEITEEDAIAEGLPFKDGDGKNYLWRGRGYHGGTVGDWGPCYHFAKEPTGVCACNVGGTTPAQCAFREVWDRLNAKRGYSWSANPFVWAIEFKRMEAKQ